MILLSDANVLIDMGLVGGLNVLAEIADVEVLDVVLLECEHDNQPGLRSDILAAGIKAIRTEHSWLEQAKQY